MAEFYTVVTDKGLEALRNCIDNNIPFAPKKMAIGDSNGSYYEPETTQTSLKNQLYVSDIATKGKKGNYLFFNFQVPPSEGEYTIRETGLFDGEGNLLAVAKYPETLKSKVNSTNEKSLIIELQIQLSNKAINTIIIDDCDNFANINLSNISDEAVKKIKGLCGNVYYEELKNVGKEYKITLQDVVDTGLDYIIL